jgi:hypothetical protein
MGGVRASKAGMRASGGDQVMAAARWLGHSSPEITYRVHAYLRPDGGA